MVKGLPLRWNDSFSHCGRTTQTIRYLLTIPWAWVRFQCQTDHKGHRILSGPTLRRQRPLGGDPRQSRATGTCKQSSAESAASDVPLDLEKAM